MAELQTLQCPNCGAQATFDPSALARVCEFCGSEFRIPIPDQFIEVRNQSSVVPFMVDRATALRLFDEWLRKGLFKPGDLLQTLERRGVEGMYVPFWGFDVAVRTYWHGQFGVTRYRRVSKTRIASDGKTEHYTEDEPYREWHPRSGVNYAQYLEHIVASGALSQDEADRVFPYDLSQLRPYDEAYIAGFKAEVPGRPRDDAWRVAVARIQRYEHAACARQIERLDSASTEFLHSSSRLSYLPMWIFSYNYRGKPYRAVVNGQTGEVQGTKPVSAGKVVLAVVIAIVVIAATAGFIALMSR